MDYVFRWMHPLLPAGPERRRWSTAKTLVDGRIEVLYQSILAQPKIGRVSTFVTQVGSGCCEVYGIYFSATYTVLTRGLLVFW